MQALRRIRHEDQTPFAPPHASDRHVERFQDWEARLQDRLKKWSTRSFEWGRADCLHFAFDCVEGITGTNYICDIESYGCEREALDVLASIDQRGLLHAVERYLGPAEEIAPTIEPFRPGDLVLTMRKVIGEPRRRGPGLGICVGDTALFIGARGLDETPLRDCLCGWRI